MIELLRGGNELQVRLRVHVAPTSYASVNISATVQERHIVTIDH